MEIEEIFQNIVKIEPKVVSIERLFSNPDNVRKTNYEPWYQRKYVWDNTKATYFIESILLGTEIPPLIYFRSGDNIEVIDGRQRYETILKFVQNQLKLKKNGLQILRNVGIEGKTFLALEDQLRDAFWDTKLRIIEFSIPNKSLRTQENEETVKKEIFKRYNTGITPLKVTEIDKAAYYEDEVNAYFKKKLEGDQVLYGDVLSLFHSGKPNLEVLLRRLRRLFVQHEIPIRYYSIKKDIIITEYYKHLFSSLKQNAIDDIYRGFIRKINLLKNIKKSLLAKNISTNRLVFECFYWAFSIIEKKHLLDKIDTKIIKQLTDYTGENIGAFEMERSAFAPQVFTRYQKTADFFEKKLSVSFDEYLNTSSAFIENNKELNAKKIERKSFDELRINKPDPYSTAIVDICRQMGKERFLLRPPYQRKEALNRKKSSAIIESILLGIKLPPIFVYKREDGISEVLDGQQRLLSILAYIQKPYLDEKNEIVKSDKHGFYLNTRQGILKHLHTKRFHELPEELQDSIENFDLWIIEINEKNNKNFEPIDLFIRLNNKPYPIKENTFEMWNSHISRDIVERVKAINTKNEDWLYFKRANSRMEHENLYTYLIYLQFCFNRKGKDNIIIPDGLEIYNRGAKINFRVTIKNEITKVLEDSTNKDVFLKACDDLENFFIKNLKTLLVDGGDKSLSTINNNLDSILNTMNSRRTQQSFYALWHFLLNISTQKIDGKKLEIRDKLRQLFIAMSNGESMSRFKKRIQDFWKLYS